MQTPNGTHYLENHLLHLNLKMPLSLFIRILNASGKEVCKTPKANWSFFLPRQTRTWSIHGSSRSTYEGNVVSTSVTSGGSVLVSDNNCPSPAEKYFERKKSSRSETERNEWSLWSHQMAFVAFAVVS